MLMNEQHKRRIDIVLEEGFVVGLENLDLETLRDRRDMVEQVETELSYYRRLLHGRQDLLAFEMKRRSGEETRSIMDALTEILAGNESTGGGEHRIRGGFAPELATQGNRAIDRVLGDDFLAHLPSLNDDDLAEVEGKLSDAEKTVTDQRNSVHAVHEALQAQVTSRYENGVPAE
jgi:hypothetical protein